MFDMTETECFFFHSLLSYKPIPGQKKIERNCKKSQDKQLKLRKCILNIFLKH